MTAGRTLLVASTGGHLDELARLRPRLVPAADDAHWVTFDDAHSRSLLAGETVHVVDHIPPRGYLGVARTVRFAASLLRRGDYARVVSTGAAIAIPFLTAARALGIEAHYIESAARTERPSLTGTVVSRLPGVRLYSQYAGWPDRRWHCRGSLFDGFESSQRSRPPVMAQRVVVTLGTMRDYGFRTAVERLARELAEVLSPDAEVLWQVGATDLTGLGIQGRQLVPMHELRAAMADADLVVAHAGIGSTLGALEAGHCPVLLPRRFSRGEHVDDHQVLIADALSQRKLAVARDAAEVTAADLVTAMATSVNRDPNPRPFLLD